MSAKGAQVSSALRKSAYSGILSNSVIPGKKLAATEASHILDTLAKSASGGRIIGAPRTRVRDACVLSPRLRVALGVQFLFGGTMPVHRLLPLHVMLEAHVAAQVGSTT